MHTSSSLLSFQNSRLAFEVSLSGNAVARPLNDLTRPLGHLIAVTAHSVSFVFTVQLPANGAPPKHEMHLQNSVKQEYVHEFLCVGTL
jgi:hypothetical protein